MFEVGDLIRLNNDVLNQHGYTCDPHAVFQILRICDSYPSFIVGYGIDAILDGNHIAKCKTSEANCLVGSELVLPYEDEERTFVPWGKDWKRYV